MEIYNHDQRPGKPTAVVKDIHSHLEVIEELDNPFEEDKKNSLMLRAKEIANPSAKTNSIQEWLIDPKLIDGTINCSNLTSFGSSMTSK